MLIVRIKTRDLVRVTRKFELKRARLLAIVSTEETYEMIYALDEYGDYQRS